MAQPNAKPCSFAVRFLALALLLATACWSLAGPARTRPTAAPIGGAGGHHRRAAGQTLLDLKALWHKSPTAVKRAFAAKHAKVVTSKQSLDRGKPTLVATYKNGTTVIAEFGKGKLALVQVLYSGKMDWKSALKSGGMSASGVTFKTWKSGGMYTMGGDLKGLKGLAKKPSVAWFAHYPIEPGKTMAFPAAQFNGKYSLFIVTVPLGP